MVGPRACLPELRELLLRQESLQPVRGQRAPDRLLRQREVADLAGVQQLDEVAIGERLRVRREEIRLDREDRDDGVPDREATLSWFHAIYIASAAQIPTITAVTQRRFMAPL